MAESPDIENLQVFESSGTGILPRNGVPGRGLYALLILSALPLLGVFTLLRGVGPWPLARESVQVGLGVAGLAWLLSLFVAWRLDGASRDAGGSGTRFTVILVVLVALGVRGLVLGASPELSDDVYRYVWDGRVLLQGTSPYRHAPLAEELSSVSSPLVDPSPQ